jgi:hypothetical protein
MEANVMRGKSLLISVIPFLAISTALILSPSLEQPGQAQAAQVQPVVVELFTSQGCSSCPPADAFMEQLAAEPDVVAITRPVTYWDRLGWKDSLAREENTALQRAYAERGGEGAGVYTPQIMVQGQLGAVGSNRALVRTQITRARKALSVAVAIRPSVIAVAGQGAPAEVKLIGLKTSRIVRIGSGENGGRVVRYSNIAVGEKQIGKWLGGAKSFALPQLSIPGADRYAVIVQSGSGPILAGRYL